MISRVDDQYFRTNNTVNDNFFFFFMKTRQKLSIILIDNEKILIFL